MAVFFRLETSKGKNTAADPYAVPDGNVAELFEFISGLMRIRPGSLEEYLELQEKRPLALETAADKIMKLETTTSTPDRGRCARGRLQQ